METRTFFRGMSAFMLALTVFFAGCKTTGPGRATGGQEGYSADSGYTGTIGKLAVLPFTGGQNQANDAIPDLLARKSRLGKNFRIIPRTSAIDAIRQEQRFQTSGMTNDDIAAIGRQMGAEYVLSGTITNLGGQNLLIVSIIEINVIQQVSGTYLMYDTLDTLQQDETLLDGVANQLVSLALKTGNSGDLDRLAVVPVQFGDGTSQQEGDVLAQLLSIHLLRNGKYAVYSRTQNLDAVKQEYKNQFSGNTAEDQQASAGHGVNPRFVLSVQARRLESVNIFQASIISLEDGTQENDADEEYTGLRDGMLAMDFLARELSGISISQQDRNRRDQTLLQWKNASDAQRKQQEQEQEKAERERIAEERRQEARRKWNLFLSNSGFGFGGWAGFIIYKTGETVEKTNDDGTTSTVDEAKGELEWGADIELQLSRYFALQGGFAMLNYVNSGTYLKTTVYQIPLLVKLNFSGGGDSISNLNGILSIYGGAGINLGEPSYDYSGTFPVETVSSAPYSLIAGAELGVGTVFRLFVGARYSLDLEESTVRIDGHDFSQKRSLLILYGRITIMIPFRNGK